MTDTSTTTPAAPKEPEREVAFENLIAGRLALQVLRNQIDTQIVGLQAQLAVTQAHMRNTEEMLERANDKLARHHPEVYAALIIEADPVVKRARR
jgi:hypothetical protein